MGFRKRPFWILAVVVIVALGVGGTAVAMASGTTSAQPSAGQIDDGAELLPQASITLDQAIAAAQGAANGAVGEVDLERYGSKLVFNVDIGDSDVKVDASNGNVLGSVQDD